MKSASVIQPEGLADPAEPVGALVKKMIHLKYTLETNENISLVSNVYLAKVFFYLGKTKYEIKNRISQGRHRYTQRYQLTSLLRCYGSYYFYSIFLQQFCQDAEQ